MSLSNFLKLAAFGTSLTAAGAGTAAAPANPHPTIRTMSGATPLDSLDPKTTALVVIDFQNEYFTGKMPIPDGKKAMANARRLVRFADAVKMPVFAIQHVAPAGSPLFAIDGDAVKFHPDMKPRAQDRVLQKRTVSAFASTDLERRLKDARIETIIVAGLMTHACVAGAARDAVPRGFHVVVASDASATRSITRVNGATVDDKTLHRSALAEIEDTFGDVLTTSEILDLPLR